MPMRCAWTTVLLLAFGAALGASLIEHAYARGAPVPVRVPPPATQAKTPDLPGNISLACGKHGAWTGIVNNTGSGGFPLALCQGPGNTYYAAALQGLNAVGMTAQQMDALNNSVTTVKCTPSAAGANALAAGNGEFGAAQHAGKSADITFTIKPPLAGAVCVVSNPAFAGAANPVMPDTTLLVWGGNNASSCTIDQMAQRFDLICHF